MITFYVRSHSWHYFKKNDWRRANKEKKYSWFLISSNSLIHLVWVRFSLTLEAIRNLFKILIYTFHVNFGAFLEKNLIKKIKHLLKTEHSFSFQSHILPKSFCKCVVEYKFCQRQIFILSLWMSVKIMVLVSTHCNGRPKLK